MATCRAEDEQSGGALFPLLKQMVNALDEGKPPNVGVRETPDAMYLMGCIDGALQTWRAVETHKLEPISIPKNISRPQLLRILLKFEREHPEVMSEEISALAGLAIWDAFRTDK